MLEELKKRVYWANMRLKEENLAALTWGNASGRDFETGLVVIKPSGVPYGLLKPRDMVVVDLDGVVREGNKRPSTDCPTHLELYRAFADVGGVVHTHSPEATAWAQAGREIPCYGTTHADVFRGVVPLARVLTPNEVDAGYELNTGRVIIERFADLDYKATPGVLLSGHAPFTWGCDVMSAVDNAVALEAIARMARYTEAIAGAKVLESLPQHVADKHYNRKHGPNAYYGQGK